MEIKREILKHLSQDAHKPTQDSNQVPHKYKSDIKPLLLTFLTKELSLDRDLNQNMNQTASEMNVWPIY
jgi:hypothetical protein